MKSSLFQNEELNNLVSESVLLDSDTAMIISSYKPNSSVLAHTFVDHLYEPISSPPHTQQMIRTHTKLPQSLSFRQKIIELSNTLCNIPSIPHKKRKFGYYESKDGALCPLEDVVQFLREGNVLL